MANIGIEVDTKSFGMVTVREPSFEDIIKNAGSVVKLFESFGEIKDSESNLWIIDMLQKPELLHSLRQVAGACTDKDAKDFISIPMSDWLKLAAGVKKAVDWEQMKTVFFELVPRGTLKLTQNQ